MEWGCRTVANAMMRHWLTIFEVPAVICSDQGSEFVGAWFRMMCKHMGIRHAKTVAYHRPLNGRAEVAVRQIFEKFRHIHIDETGRNWYNSLRSVHQAYHDLPRPTGLSPHRILFLRDRVSRTLPWLNLGKDAQDVNAMMAETDDTAARVCKTLQACITRGTSTLSRGKSRSMPSRTPYGWSGTQQDVLSRHRQASWYVPGIIVRKVGQDVYADQVWDNNVVARDHTQLHPRAADPSGRPVTFEFRAGDWNSNDEAEDDDFTAERMVTEKLVPGRPGGGCTRSVGRDLQLVWFGSEVQHGLDEVSKEQGYFLRCQGRVGPFGACDSPLMKTHWHPSLRCDEWETK